MEWRQTNLVIGLVYEIKRISVISFSQTENEGKGRWQTDFLKILFFSFVPLVDTPTRDLSLVHFTTEMFMSYTWRVVYQPTLEGTNVTLNFTFILIYRNNGTLPYCKLK